MEAGMDDYLSKPVRGEELAAKLVGSADRRPPTAAQGSGVRGQGSGVREHEQQSADAMQDMLYAPFSIPHSPSSIPHSPAEPLDAEIYAEFVSTMGGATSDAIRKVVTFFLRDTTERLDTLQQALARQDAALLFQTAHAMKSSSAMMGALHFSALCKQLEAHGRTGNTSGLQPLLTELTAEFARVENALQRHTTAGNAETCKNKTDVTIDEEMLKHLPQTWLKAMHHTARLGSIEQAETLIAELAPQHTKLAEQLTWLVEQFRFEQIVTMLDPLLHEEG
jgi:HPt (histidine-containing phosphotransfer) domain-containing protein